MDDSRPPALAPTEAYAAIEALAAARGEAALRLATHAALPQVLRGELLHGLRLNFAPDTLGDAALEADLLFAPFARPLGHGAVAFDPEVRAQLLKLLDVLNPGETPPRSLQVADFVLAWLDRERLRARADDDLLYAGWIEAERWNALAFADPDAAAGQLAAAVAQAAPGAGRAVRLRVGALAATLATPLAAHARLLRYARGIESLHDGQPEAARDWLAPLGDAAIVEGPVALQAPAELLRAFAAGPSPPVAAPAQAQPVPLRVAVLVSGSDMDDHFAAVTDEVRRCGHHVVGWDADRAGDVPCDLVLALLGWSAGTRVTGGVPWIAADLRAARQQGLPLDAFVPDPSRFSLVKLMDPSLKSLRDDLAAQAPLRTFADAAELRARVATSLRVAADRPRTAPPAPPEPGSVFIAFLADDALDAASRLAEVLRGLGFQVDQDGSGDGPEVQLALDAAATRCATLLALIGPRTVSMAAASAGAGFDRLMPQARRVAAVLQRPGKWVIPVLLDGTPMPRAAQLPAELAPIVERQALRLDRTRWEADLAALLQAVGAPPRRAVPPLPPPRRALLLLDNRRHRDLFDLLARALQREGCEPEMPDGVFGSARPLAMIVVALRRVDCVVLDLSLPDDWLIPWTDGVAEVGVPLVPVQDAREPARERWAAHVRSDPARTAWVAPTLDWDELRGAAAPVGARILAAVAAVRARSSLPTLPSPPAELPREGRLRLALCATQLDLGPFRAAVREVTESFGQEVIEAWVGERPPVQVELAAVERCHVAVFVVAWRYGYVPVDAELNPGERSLTELQYRHAVKLNRDRLVLVVEDVSDWPSDWYDRGDQGERIRRFRRELALDPATRPVRSVEQAREHLQALLAARTQRQAEPLPAGRALLFVGHTIDAPDRPAPRFPAALEPAAAAALRSAVEAELRRGPVSFAAASGSHGGDILFLEACAACGVPTRIFLPEPDRKFVEHFVAPAGADWVERFGALARRSPVVVLAEEGDAIDVGSAHSAQRDRWQRNADAMLDAVRHGGREPPTLVALWDGAPTESPGGPTYLLARADTLGLRRVVIDPASLGAPAVPAGRTLIFEGHGLDAPGRPTPRFPRAIESAVAAAIDAAVAREVGAGGVLHAVACASPGGDLLFLESCARRDLPTTICLPFPEERFLVHVREAGGEDWVRRYLAVSRRAEVRVLPTGARPAPAEDDAARWAEAWQHNADAMFEIALAGGAAGATLLALWDGQPAETASRLPVYMIERADRLGVRRVVIDPRRLGSPVQPAKVALELVAGQALMAFDAAVEAPLRLAAAGSLLLAQLAAEAAASRDAAPGIGIDGWRAPFAGMGWDVEHASVETVEGTVDVARELRSRTLQLVGPRPAAEALDAALRRIAALGRGQPIDAMDARFAADDAGCSRAALAHVRRFDDGRIRLALSGVELWAGRPTRNPFGYRGPTRSPGARFATLVAMIDASLLEGMAPTLAEKVAPHFDRLVTPLRAWEAPSAAS